MRAPTYEIEHREGPKAAWTVWAMDYYDEDKAKDRVRSLRKAYPSRLFRLMRVGRVAVEVEVL